MGRRGLQLALLMAVITASLFFGQKAVASSTSPVIYQLQTGSSTGATQEYVSIYNNNGQPVDVTNWCLTYSSASDTSQTTLGCLAPPDNHTKMMLPSHGVAMWASSEFSAAHPGLTSDVLFTAGISGTSGHVRVLNAAKQEIDRLGWGAAVNSETTAAVAAATGKVLERIEAATIRQDSDNNSADFAQVVLSVLPSSGLYEEDVPIDVCPNIPNLQLTIPDGFLLDASGNCQQDVCINLDGLQLAVPTGYESIDGENCMLIPLEGTALTITELLPDATSTDAGKEFIEIYNPNNRSVNLSGYVLQLGPSYTNSYSFPGQVIAIGAYLAVSDTQTSITLPNTAASVRLVAPNGTVVSETASYNAPGEDVSWALIGNSWQMTYQPTPNAANVLLSSKPCPAGQERSDETGFCRTIDSTLSSDNSLVPCKDGQERNPDTNRCRTIATLASALVPCSVGQERNPETNRCRSLVASASALVPCRDDQERNPETNRCRSTASTASALQPCAPGQERNPETNRCRKSSDASSVAGLSSVKDVPAGSITNNPKWWLAGVAAIGATGYGFYEWRQEIVGSLNKFTQRIPGISSK